MATTVSEVARARRHQHPGAAGRRRLGRDDTDVTGLVASIAHVEHDGRARVLGSGATARSAVLALAEVGVERLTIAARNPATARDAVALAEGCWHVGVGDPLESWIEDPVRLVISTLPGTASVGVGGLLSEAGQDFVGMTVLDVVYADWPTPWRVMCAAPAVSDQRPRHAGPESGCPVRKLFTGVGAPSTR